MINWKKNNLKTKFKLIILQYSNRNRKCYYDNFCRNTENLKDL